jgi:hypothetical protein
MVVKMRRFTLCLLVVCMVVSTSAVLGQPENLELLQEGAAPSNLVWSTDSQNLVFLRGDSARGVETSRGEWVNYNTTTKEITTSNVWPLLPKLSTSEIETLSPTQNGLTFMFESPDGRYFVYSQAIDEDEIVQYLAVADRTTQTMFTSEGDMLYSPSSSINGFNVLWSADSSAIVAAQSAPFAEGYLYYYVSDFSTDILDAERTLISEEIGNRTLDYRMLQIPDISDDGDTLLLYGTEVDRSQPEENWKPKLVLWNAADPNSSQILDKFDADGLIGVSFVGGSSTKLLIINTQGLILYDAPANTITLLNSEINSTWATSALFSPDSTHVALLAEPSYTEIYVADIRHDLSIQKG